MSEMKKTQRGAGGRAFAPLLSGKSTNAEVTFVRFACAMLPAAEYRSVAPAQALASNKPPLPQLPKNNRIET